MILGPHKHSLCPATKSPLDEKCTKPTKTDLYNVPATKLRPITTPITPTTPAPILALPPRPRPPATTYISALPGPRSAHAHAAPSSQTSKDRAVAFLGAEERRIGFLSRSLDFAGVGGRLMMDCGEQEARRARGGVPGCRFEGPVGRRDGARGLGVGAAAEEGVGRGAVGGNGGLRGGWGGFLWAFSLLRCVCRRSVLLGRIDQGWTTAISNTTGTSNTHSIFGSN